MIVRVAGAGLCRTDIHIRDGWFATAVPALPLTLGHENAGWVHEIGSAVENVAVRMGVPEVGSSLSPAAIGVLHCRRGHGVP